MRKQINVEPTLYRGVRTYDSRTKIELWGSESIWKVLYTHTHIIDQAIEEEDDDLYDIEVDYYYICVEDEEGVRINVSFNQVAAAYRWDENAKAGLTEFLERTA